MALKVLAMKNSLPTAKNPFYARGFCDEIISENELIEKMAQGRTTLSQTDILAVMQLLMEEVVKNLIDGHKVKTSLGIFYPVVMGNLKGVDDNFSLKNESLGHRVKVNFILKKKISDTVRQNIKILQEESLDLSPGVIYSVVSARAQDGLFRSKEIITLTGHRLKFETEDLEQGLFVVPEAGTEIRIEVYIRVKPSLVIVELPELKPGKYKLVVKTMPNHIDLKTSCWGQDLIIVA